MKTWNSISQSFEKFTRGWKEGGVARAMCLSHLQIQKPVEQPPLRGHVVALDLGACPGDGSVARLTLCGRQLGVMLQYCVTGPLHYHLSAQSGHRTRESMGNNICSLGGLFPFIMPQVGKPLASSHGPSLSLLSSIQQTYP